MIFGRRSPKLPPDVGARLDRRDSPLAHAELTDGRWAVAAAGALVVADADGVVGRYPWHTVEHGRWDGDAGELTVAWVDGAVTPLVLRPVEHDPARFTSTLRERVQSSVVHTESLDTPGGAFVRVNIRRDENGGLLSQVTVQGQLRGDDAERKLIDDLERRARSAVGLAT
ncbi:hypothetical protein ATJ97_3860 [Georgenia soli]|uniref:Uncharacterized protein n=1 Tax=Georgenia soli TaxID=638953 RepID=A0A2A9ERZ2_9MICO|nr:hypothetical protein [Georgenia soli]PFG41311.1 hypothetical protein ATJ97_3860 [Georgenia soli]